MSNKQNDAYNENKKEFLDENGIKVTMIDTTYLVEGTHINVLEEDGEIFQIAVRQDGDIITSFDNWTEVLEVTSALSKIHHELVKDCQMCSAYQDEHVNQFCPKHS